MGQIVGVGPAVYGLLFAAAAAPTGGLYGLLLLAAAAAPAPVDLGAGKPDLGAWPVGSIRGYGAPPNQMP